MPGDGEEEEDSEGGGVQYDARQAVPRTRSGRGRGLQVPKVPGPYMPQRQHGLQPFNLQM